jgi:hypothetical protein
MTSKGATLARAKVFPRLAGIAAGSVETQADAERADHPLTRADAEGR